MLEVFAPGSRRRVIERRIANRPWLAPSAGDVLRAGRGKVRVTSVGARVDRSGDRLEHVIEVYTRSLPRRRTRQPEPASNVVAMPRSDGSVVAEFLRYHVLVRVYDGDPDAWLAQLRGGGDEGDLRFARWVRSRLRQDPSLLAAIRKMVDSTPFWRVAEA